MGVRFVSLVVFGCVLAGGAGAEEVVSFGRFGSVALYAGTPRPSHVVLFVSGDGGWNKGVVDMARELATLDALVAGIDINHYLKQLAASGEGCAYPASDFEALSQYLQKKRDFPRYVTPLLVGYSSGATLVYAILAEAPPGTFLGAVSLGFCPDLPFHGALCRGRGLAWAPGPKGKGINVLPATDLTQHWVVLQGTIDQVCSPPETGAFVAKVPSAQLIVLPKVGHGFAVPRNWMPQFRGAFLRLVAPQLQVAAAATPAPRSPSGEALPDVSDLPLIELPAPHPEGDALAIVVSGDGGWASLDRDVGEALAAHGVPVVGLDSLRYFWSKRTPEEASHDLARIAAHYLAAWRRTALWLVGYSRGADVLPFMIDRLSPEMRARVRLVALLGLEPRIDFEFHLADWLGGGGGGLPVEPEVAKLAGIKVLCFFGEAEKDSLCPRLPSGLVQPVAMSGAHHFGGAYGEIAERILEAGR